MPTLVPHAASKCWEGHILEDIPRVIPYPKSQDGDAHGVGNWGAFAAMAGAATSVCVVVALKAATVSYSSDAISTATASVGLHDLCRHSQLDAHCLGATGVQETGRCAPHITLLDEGSEGGVQARWAVVGEELELVTEVHKGDGGEGAWMG